MKATTHIAGYSVTSTTTNDASTGHVTSNSMSARSVINTPAHNDNSWRLSSRRCVVYYRKKAFFFIAMLIYIYQSHDDH
jgi:hypothetical protein